MISVYSHSLYWLVRHAGLTNIVIEVLKDGEPVVYGQLTAGEVNRLAQKGQLRNFRRHAWGISWPFKDQIDGGDDDFSDFAAWREKILAEAKCFQYAGEFIDPSSWIL